MPSFNLAEANGLLPLVKAIAAEVAERRGDRQRAVRLREQLEACHSPEGLVQALADLDAAIREHDDALDRSRRELAELGLSVLRMNPLTVHFPGRATPSEVVFCWMEGDADVDHGHLPGKEEEPRRPLRIRRNQ